MTLRTISALLLFQGISAWGASPWVPGAGKASVTLTYVDESFNSYWNGTEKRSFPQPPSSATVFDQKTGYATLEYGLSNRLSLDLLTGYTATIYGADGLQGVADSQIGLRYQVYNGERTVFTVRGAGNFAGTYPLTTKSRFNAGDKANGMQWSALAGRTFNHGMYLFGEGGWRYRSVIPSAAFGSVGAGQRIGHVSYGVAYQHNQALDGVDIGTPAFHGFPSLRETMQVQMVADANVGYTTMSGLYFGFDYAHVLHGRNTGDKQILAFTLGFTIPGRGPHFK